MFTQQELMAIIKICDAGVRAGGLEIAEMAIPICHKIRQMAQQQQQRIPQTVSGNSKPQHEVANAL